MSFTKQIIMVAAVGALTAATAVPALALENEFHGLYKVRGIVSNAQTPGGGWVYDLTTPVATNKGPGGILGRAGSDDAKANTYIDQRARIMYQAKANDDLKLVTQFEIDSAWGDNSYNLSRNQGGGIGADHVNLETKSVYLDFNVPKTPVNVKLGIQGFMDNYKGIIFSNDAAGAVAKAKLGAATVQAAYFRFDDAYTGSGVASYYDAGTEGTTNTTVTAAGNNTLGANSRDFANLGVKYAISKSFAVGADYYLLYSDLNKVSVPRATNIHMAGVNAEANFGAATVSGFAIYQAGRVANTGLQASQRVNAYAANLAAKVKTPAGALRWTALYVSGDKSPGTGGERSDFQTIMERTNNTGGNSFLEAESQMLLRGRGNTNTDKAVVYDLNNNGRGVITTWLGYDLPLGRAYINTNAGVALVAKKPSTRVFTAPNGGVGDGRIVGAEINTEVGYKVYDNLTAAVQGAYVVLGDYYHGAARDAAGRPANPENPYITSVVMNYTF